MNSILSQADRVAGATSRMSRTDDGLASTFKTPQLPDSGAFTEWISTPSLEDASPNARLESDIFDASLRAITQHRRRDNSMPELKLVDFSVELPEANRVQLVADFTEWEQNPLNMIRFDRGIWSMTVPLPGGIYAYRFLVDGQSYDDPRAIRRDANSCGVAKAFVHVK